MAPRPSNRPITQPRCHLLWVAVFLSMLTGVLVLFAVYQGNISSHVHDEQIRKQEIDDDLASVKRNNTDMNLNRTVSGDERQSPPSSSSSPPPRIILLPGPHKSGSTGVQMNLHAWAQSGHFYNWVWPVPTASACKEAVQRQQFPLKTVFCDRGIKEFANIPFLLRSTHYSEIKTTDPLLTLYRSTLKQAYDRGENLIVASEGMDAVVDTALDYNFLDRLLNVLPSQQNVSVVIVHREPRVSHLHSLWHEIGSNSSLSTFLKGPVIPFHFHVLNSMALAEAFAERDFPVTIVDMDGVQRHGHMITPVIACQVMKVPCTNYSIDGDFTQPHRANERKDVGQMDVSVDKLQSIEEIMHQHDCQYQHLLSRRNVEVLFRERLFRNCSSSAPLKNNKTTFVSWKDILNKIVRVVSD